MNELKVFNFEKSEVRTQIINNEPWFCLKDVCEILEIKNPTDVSKRLFKEELTRLNLGGRSGNTNFVNESGLYNVIFRSDKSQAIGFRRWVTSEVLPTIRKHGAYMTPDKIEEALLNPDTIIQLATTLKQEREEKMLLEQQIAEYEPKINYLDMILSSTDTVTITQIAADYGMSAVAMNRLLNELEVQHKVGGQWILYKKHMKQGYTKSHTSEIAKADGGVKVVMNTKWTQKGRLFLYDLMKDEGYLPQMDLELEETEA